MTGSIAAARRFETRTPRTLSPIARLPRIGAPGWACRCALASRQRSPSGPIIERIVGCGGARRGATIAKEIAGR